MQIQTNSDHTIKNHESLAAHVESVVQEALSKVSEHITRVVVHLSETNDHQHSGGDYRCVMEARIEGHPPFATSDHAASLHQAIQGAAEKLKRTIDSTLGRINDNTKRGSVIADKLGEENIER
jgi:ribosome-associated translation inhibitor RaiA